MSEPSIVKVSLVGSTNHAMDRGKVVFPHPDGPGSVKNSFCAMLTFISRNCSCGGLNSFGEIANFNHKTAIDLLNPSDRWR